MKSARVLSLGSAFGLAFGLCTFAVSEQSAFAQFPPPPGAGPPGGVQCNDFANITAEAKKRSALVAAALKSKADRKEVCTLMTSFVSAESNVVKFLQDNKVWCGVPDQIVTISKTNHEKSIKFRTAVCEEAPHPKPPTLSDAIKAPSLDTAKNTKTGRGTLDTLTGNPLAH